MRINSHVKARLVAALFITSFGLTAAPDRIDLWDSSRPGFSVLTATPGLLCGVESNVFGTAIAGSCPSGPAEGLNGNVVFQEGAGQVSRLEWNTLLIELTSFEFSYGLNELGRTAAGFQLFAWDGIASAVTIDAPIANPAALPSATATSVTVSARINRQPTEPAVVPNGVNLVRVNSDGTTQVLAIMNDGGTNGDQVAGDGIFTVSTVLSATQVVSLRVTAALQGVRSRVQSPITDLPVVGGQTSAQVTISVFETDLANPPTFVGTPASSGVLLFANGVQVGTTDSAGRSALTLLAGDYDVEARIPGAAVGRVTLSLLAGQTAAATILLDREKEVYEDAVLTIDEVSNSVLANTAQTITLRFRKGASQIAVKALGSVTMVNEDGQFVSAIDDRFTIQPDGSLRAQTSALSSLLQAQQRSVNFEVSVLGTDNLPYSGTIRFYYGRFTLAGTLQAPPSRPGLGIGALPVNIVVLQTNLQYSVTTNASGQFTVPGLLPLGLVEIRSQTSEGGKFYYGLAQFILDRNRNVKISMLSDVDVLGGVPPFTFSAAVAAQSLSAVILLGTEGYRTEPSAQSSTAAAGDIAPPRIGPGPPPPWATTGTKFAAVKAAEYRRTSEKASTESQRTRSKVTLIVE